MENLKLRLNKKLNNEYEIFITDLKNNTPEEIIDRSYEKVCKDEIVFTIQDKKLTEIEYKSLLSCKNILDQCYMDWLKSDGNFIEILSNSIDETKEKLLSQYQRNTIKRNSKSRWHNAIYNTKANRKS